MAQQTSLSLLLLLILVGVNEVLGCSCSPSAPCNDFGRADVVFLGKAVGSKYQTRQTEYDYSFSTDRSPKAIEVTYDIGEIYFEVEESFKGTEKGKRITIHSIPGGAACGSSFRRGKSYLIFASKEGSTSDSGISSYTGGRGSVEPLKPDANRLWTGLCSGNRQLEAASEALSFLRTSSTGSMASIVGTAYESINNYAAERVSAKVYPNLEVTASKTTDSNTVFKGKTDDKGRFLISVPEGKYVVRPVLSAALTFTDRYESEPEPVEVSSQRCAVKQFFVSNGSRVTGRLLNRPGEPDFDVRLDLIPVGKSRGEEGFDYKFSIPEEDGTFSFEGIPVGRYYLSLNYATMPEEDSPYPTTFLMDRSGQDRLILDIGLGTSISGLEFRMPPKLSKAKINGKVVWKNGEPAVGAEVKLHDVEFDRNAIFRPTKTDQSGNFEIEWFSGRRYRLEVIVWQKVGDGSSAYGIGDAKSSEFVIDRSTPPFRLVIDRNNPAEKTTTRTTVRAPRRRN